MRKLAQVLLIGCALVALTLVFANTASAQCGTPGASVSSGNLSAGRQGCGTQNRLSVASLSQLPAVALPLPGSQAPQFQPQNTVPTEDSQARYRANMGMRQVVKNPAKMPAKKAKVQPTSPDVSREEALAFCSPPAAGAVMFPDVPETNLSGGGELIAKNSR